MNFPPLGLLNRYYLGDSVMLEPIAVALAEVTRSRTFIISRYADLFQNHPSVDGLQPEGPFPPGLRVVDMSDAISSSSGGLPLAGKCGRLWQAAGFSGPDGRVPRLYLSSEEKYRAGELRRLFSGKCVGLVLGSNMPVKVWPHMEKLMSTLCREGYDVFAIDLNLDKHNRYLLNYGAYQVIGKSLRDLMTYLSFMDIVVGGDTGPTHVAAALGTDTVVITREFGRDIWPYQNCELLTVESTRKRALRKIKADEVYDAMLGRLGDAVPKPKQAKIPHDTPIALFRLDGLGGTITLADHAKKIHELTGRKCTAIVRAYGVAFRDNPDIEGVIEVGHVKWHDCVEEMKLRFDTLAEIRFAPAKWHQSNGKLFEQDFDASQGLFDDFPSEYRKLEIHGLHHVQLTDKFLGLPYDSIDMEIYYYEDFPEELPDRYIVINNGVDVQHGSMRQTKTWNRWKELVELCDLPVVQVGTLNDPEVPGTIDIRGKTSIAQMFKILRNASAAVCTEGGLMHTAYAVKTPNVVVMRGPTRGKLFEYPCQRFVDSYMCDICWSSTDDWYARCPKGLDAVCMNSITAERVSYNIKEALNENLA